MNRRRLGSKFEQIASDYLIKNKYEIVRRNYRSGRIEIDIICTIGEELVFVEVKGVRSDAFGDPVYRVDRRKQASIIKAAEGFIQESTRGYTSYRFDVIVVDARGDPPELNHIINAFTL